MVVGEPHWRGSPTTISERVRGFGLRRCRYIDLFNTTIYHMLISSDMNLSDWPLGFQATAESRLSLPHDMYIHPETAEQYGTEQSGSPGWFPTSGPHRSGRAQFG